jgi:hypothetical protein
MSFLLGSFEPASVLRNGVLLTWTQVEPHEAKVRQATTMPEHRLESL